MNVTDKGK